MLIICMRGAHNHWNLTLTIDRLDTMHYFWKVFCLFLLVIGQSDVHGVFFDSQCEYIREKILFSEDMQHNIYFFNDL